VRPLPATASEPPTLAAPTLLDPAAIESLVAPLDLEQGLHLLDSLTWFPQADEHRWERIVEYVNQRCPDSAPTRASTVRAVTTRVLGGRSAPADLTNRWATMVNPKWLYQLKYSLKAALFSEPWFTCMNMGYAPTDGTGPCFLDVNGEPEIMRFSLQLYDFVGRQRRLAGRDVLEVGCGRGGGAAWLAGRYGPRSYTAVDWCHANVAFCARTHGHPGLRFMQSDAEQLPLDDEQVDIVVNIESAHCYPHFDRFLAEVGRVLRPGGTLLFADEWWADKLDELSATFAATGLRIVEQRDITAEVMAALRLQQEVYPRFIARLADARRRSLWTRFFGTRVCVDSFASYRGGRFKFLSIVAEKPAGPRTADSLPRAAPITHRGLIVAFSGVDGAGKTSQAAALTGRLTDAGYCAYLDEFHENFAYFALKSVATRRGRSDIRELFGVENVEATLAMERIRGYCMCVALARQGSIVVCPRSPWDRIAAARILGSTDKHFVRTALDFCETPDLHFFLRVSPETAMRRIAARGTDREDPDTIERYARALEEIATERGTIVIDGERPFADVQSEIWGHTEGLLRSLDPPTVSHPRHAGTPKLRFSPTAR